MAGQPYLFGHTNHTYQLPLLLKTAYPELFPTDALVATLDGYAAILYPALGHLVRLTGIGVEPLYFALCVGVRLLIVASIGVIVAGSVRTVAWWSVATIAASASGLLVTQTPMGDSTAVGPMFTHTALAFALGLGAVGLALHERYAGAGVLLAMTFWANPIVASHVAVVVFAWLLLERRLRDRRVLGGGLIFVAGAAPVAVWASGTTTPVSETFWQFLPVAFDCHFWFDHYSLSGGIVLLLVVAAVRMLLPPSRLRDLTTAALLVTGVFMLVNWLGIYVAPTRAITLLLPLRVDIWLHVLVAVALPVLLATSVEDRRTVVTPLLVVLLFAQFMWVEAYGPLMVGLAALALVTLALRDEYGAPGEQEAPGWAGWLAPATALMLAAVMAATSDSPAWALVVAGGVGGVVARKVDHADVVRSLVIGAAVAGSLGALAQEDFNWYIRVPHGAYREVAQWARQETDVDAEFVTPPQLVGWRSGSLRSTFVQLRDGSALHWAPGFEVTWWERLKALDCARPATDPRRWDATRRDYLQLTPARFVRIADTFDYGDFVVTGTEWPHRPPLEPEFANETYEVFSIDALRAWMEAGPAGPVARR